MQLANFIGVIIFILFFIVFLANIYSFVHASVQSSKAYFTSTKLSKVMWLTVLGLSLLSIVLLHNTFGSVVSSCASSIYIVSIRPKLLSVQKKAY